MAQADNKKGLYPFDPNAKPDMVPIKTGQTLTEGDAVINDSGQAAIGLAASARLAGVVGRDCASLAAGTLVPVYGWTDPDMKFVARQDGSDALVPGGEQDLVGATGAMQIDSDASSTDVFTLLQEYDTEESDAAGKRWIVRINKHHHASID